MATRNPNLNIVPALKKSLNGANGVENGHGNGHAANGHHASGHHANGNGVAPGEGELHGPRGDWWWTGKKPQDCPGFDAKHGVLR